MTTSCYAAASSHVSRIGGWRAITRHTQLGADVTFSQLSGEQELEGPQTLQTAIAVD